MRSELADDEAAHQGKPVSRGSHRGSHDNSASANLFSSIGFHLVLGGSVISLFDHVPPDGEAAHLGKSVSRGSHRGSHDNSASANLFSSKFGLRVDHAVVLARLVSDDVEVVTPAAGRSALTAAEATATVANYCVFRLMGALGSTSPEELRAIKAIPSVSCLPR